LNFAFHIGKSEQMSTTSQRKRTKKRFLQDLGRNLQSPDGHVLDLDKEIYQPQVKRVKTIIEFEDPTPSRILSVY